MNFLYNKSSILVEVCCCGSVGNHFISYPVHV